MCKEGKDFCSLFTVKVTEGQRGRKLAHQTVSWEQSCSYNSNLLSSQPSVPLVDSFSGMLVSTD